MIPVETLEGINANFLVDHAELMMADRRDNGGPSRLLSVFWSNVTSLVMDVVGALAVSALLLNGAVVGGTIWTPNGERVFVMTLSVTAITVCVHIRQSILDTTNENGSTH